MEERYEFRRLHFILTDKIIKITDWFFMVT